MKLEEYVGVGDIVEIVAGPYQGAKAEVVDTKAAGFFLLVLSEKGAWRLTYQTECRKVYSEQPRER